MLNGMPRLAYVSRRHELCRPIRVLQLILFHPDRHHVDCRVRQAVESEQVVDLTVEEPSDVHTSQPESIGNEVDILGHMTGFQQDKAVAAIPVFEDGSLE